jgi:DNA-binding CsgD family transcriptional regulator/tetratricopeptide (TPR) repeat protein
VLLGREAELQQLDDLVLRARAGQSGVIVVQGEPGSGKTSLLDQFVASLAEDVTLLRCVGVESEAHLAYAGLAGLLRPILEFISLLPPMQSSALASALALQGVERGGDQLAVAAGSLALLAAAATRAPTVVVIDDVQWLEPSSRFALLFVARRIASDRLCIVLAGRSDAAVDPQLRDLPHITLGGLDVDQATQLMSTLNTGMSPATVAGLVAATGGNPLALMEAAQGLDEWQIAGVRPLGATLTVGDHLESAFAVHLDQLSVEGRMAVALVAAEPSGERPLLLAAGAELGVDLSDFREAVDARLLEESVSTITVRHPLLRSVALRRSDRKDLGRMHQALARHLEEGEEERRAWHLASAADAPDEFVAALVESAADAALSRADVSAAVAGFEQAASLSPQRSDRGRRLFKAGAAASQLGQGDELLRQSLADTDDPARRTDIVLLRARSAIERGDHGLVARLVHDESDAVEKENRMAGALLLALGAAAAWSAAEFGQMNNLADQSMALLEEDAESSGLAILPLTMALLASVINGRPDIGLARRVAQAARQGVPAALAAPLMNSLILADQLADAEIVRISARTQCRDEGSLMALMWVDGVGMILRVRRGELAQAHAMGTAMLELIATLPTPFGLAELHANLAQIEAITGNESSCLRRVELVRRATARFGTDVVALQVEYVLGLLELGQGRFLAAVRQLERTHRELEQRGQFGTGHWPVLPDLVEAAALAGEHGEARRFLALLQKRTEHDPLPCTAVVVSRVEAMLAVDAEVSERFATALAHAQRYGNVFEEGRTHLAYGRRLAALGRPEAVEEFQLSDECFQLVGATPWAERAADELEAIGRSRPPAKSPLTELLTPHEQEVVELAITGATTREMATELFVSAKTVESHLTSSYRKLGVRSKTQLAHVLNRS